jgi:hypothetical protein
MNDELESTDARTAALDDAYRPPSAEGSASQRSSARGLIVVAGIAIGMTAPLANTVPWVLGWMPQTAIGLDPGAFAARMAPIDPKVAVIRLVLGLVALPGLLLLARVRAPKITKWEPRFSLRVAAIAWPALAAGEIVYRLGTPTRVPFTGIFHNLELIAGLLAVTFINDARRRVDVVRVLPGAVALVYVASFNFIPQTSVAALQVAGVLLNLMPATLGVTVGWAGANLASEPSSASPAGG